jgi:hypothetical protein
MTRKQFLRDALEQLEAHTGVPGVITEPKTSDTDGLLTFRYDGRTQKTHLVVRRFVHPAQLADIQRLTERYAPLLVVAEHIQPKVKEWLRLGGVAYLESDGNLYYRGTGILLWIERQRKGTTKVTREKTGRAFTKTGLRLVFHLLQEPALLDLTYREIAKRTGVVFGNINVVFNDLKQQGFLLELERNRIALHHRQALLERWVVGYEEKLKPSLKLGTFRFLKEEDMLNWKRIELQHDKTWWGSEPAADLLTNRLKPGLFTLYTLETRQELMRNYRLLPDEKGPVTAYGKFWQTEGADERVVPPLLVYTDLINTGDRRCMDNAKTVYEQYLQDGL